MPSGRCLPLLSVGHMMDSMEDAKMQNGQGQQVLEIPYVEERSLFYLEKLPLVDLYATFR